MNAVKRILIVFVICVVVIYAAAWTATHSDTVSAKVILYGFLALFVLAPIFKFLGIFNRLFRA